MSSKFNRNRKLVFQFIRLALISGIFFIAFLIIAGAVLTYIYRDEAKDLMIQSLNRNLKTDILVDNIQLDLFRRFPNASLTFEDVIAYEVSDDENKDTLIKANRIYFQFSIIDLIRRDYKIKRLEISDGKFTPVDYADGTNNYIFWHVSEKQPDDFEFDLQRIDLNNFEIDYKNLQRQDRYHVYFSDSRMSGKFSHVDYDMNISSNMTIKDLVIDDASFLSNRDVSFDLALLVNDNKVYQFKKGLIELSGNTYSVAGHLERAKPGSYLDLTINGRDIRLQNIINDIPVDYKKYFEDYRTRGDLYFEAIIKGHLSEIDNPVITADFGLTSGNMNNRKLNLQMDDINFKASYNNGKYRSLASSALTVEEFSAYINEGKIDANFSVNDFTDPYLNISARSDIEANDFVNLFKLENFKSASGQMLFDINLESRLNKFNKENINDRGEFFASATSGSLKLKDLNFMIEEDPKRYSNLNGLFHFSNNDLVIDNFQGLISDNDFDLEGYLINIIPYIFHEDQSMFIDANLISDRINLDELLRDRDSSADTAYKLTFSDRVDFNLNADIGRFTFRKFDANRLTGRLQMRNKKFTAKDVSFNSMTGKFDGDAYIDGTYDDVFYIGCNANLDNVDVQQMFYQFGNFGQEGIKDKNIKGNITADLQFASKWSPSLNINWESLETTADIKIEEGELIEFTPLLALSRFLRVEDLEHVMFSTLHNEIRIKDRKIIIPDMEINSSALNIKLSGEHSFENIIDYRLQVLLSDILAQKNRERRNPQEQYGDIIDDGSGQVTLFLLVTGTINDPVFQYDYRGARKKLRNDLREERKELREILKDEFSWIRRGGEKSVEDSIMKERRKETERIEKQEEGEFVIEFDDF